MTMKLDVGAGLNLKKPLDEWTHLDCDEGEHIEYVCDFGDIPLDDESVSEIWIGDVIEHIPTWRQKEVLAEWHRILKPGGTISGNTPNLEYNVRAYMAGINDLDWLLQNLYGNRYGDRVRVGPPHQHYILFTMETLDKLFRDNGFGAGDYSESPIFNPELKTPAWLVFVTVKL